LVDRRFQNKRDPLFLAEKHLVPPAQGVKLREDQLIAKAKEYAGVLKTGKVRNWLAYVCLAIAEIFRTFRDSLISSFRFMDVKFKNCFVCCARKKKCRATYVRPVRN